MLKLVSQGLLQSTLVRCFDRLSMWVSFQFSWIIGLGYGSVRERRRLQRRWHGKKSKVWMNIINGCHITLGGLPNNSTIATSNTYDTTHWMAVRNGQGLCLFKSNPYSTSQNAVSIQQLKTRVLFRCHKNNFPIIWPRIYTVTSIKRNFKRNYKTFAFKPTLSFKISSDNYKMISWRSIFCRKDIMRVWKRDAESLF